MAKLKKLPGQSIIDGFKGTIDFYLWKGIPCARMWPRSPGHDRAPAVEAQWDTFAFSGTYWQYLPLEIRNAYEQMATGHGVIARDLFTKGYISGNIIKLV